MTGNELTRAILLGVATGDALGVPVEFSWRHERDDDPVYTMRGYGTYNQPPGTWSDDTSLTLCLAESLAECGGLDTADLAARFVRWHAEAYWSARGEVFDIGVNTARATSRLASGMEPEHCGADDEMSNGNGSLMRILPLLVLTLGTTPEHAYALASRCSALTHGHVRSRLACTYYLVFAECLLNGDQPAQAYAKTNQTLRALLRTEPVRRDVERLSSYETEHRAFARVLNGDLADLPRDGVDSSGYLMHCLEASLWCILRADGYADAIQRAVNLGRDTDTTAAVTGGLAALRYGADSIPRAYLDALARRADIEALAERLAWRIPGVRSA